MLAQALAQASCLPNVDARLVHVIDIVTDEKVEPDLLGFIHSQKL
jgi:hypothetical protein